MSAPASYPDWDTNGTHTIAIVATHTTDGFGLDEVPTSDELNEWMMLVGLWIRYLGAGGSDDVETMPASAGQASASVDAGAFKYFNSAGEFFPNDVSDVLILPVKLKGGATLKEFDVLCSDSGAGNSLWTLKLWKKTDVIGSPDSSPVQLGTTQTSPGDLGNIHKLSVSGLTEVVPSNGLTSYFATLAPTAGAIAPNMRGVSFTITSTPKAA